jgi:photosystem II stability/assembly factor-like uncharacterized protein
LLVTLGLIAASCNASTPVKAHSGPEVLGQQNGTPDTVGQPAPAGTGQLDAVSCVGAQHCWAVGSPGQAATVSESSSTPTPTTVVDATVDGGKSWVAQTITLASAPALTGVSCTTVKLCMAVGLNGSASAGIVLTTRDGGTTWLQASTPLGATVITSVDCVRATACAVIASDGTTFWSALSSDFGRSWQREGDLPAGVEDAGNLFCIGGGSCIVTGFTATTAGHGQGAVDMSVNNGVTWTASEVPPGTGLLHGVVCTTTSSCVAVGTTSTTVSAIVPAKGSVLHSNDGGDTWSRADSSQPIDDIYGVSCPTPKACVIVGTNWVGKPAIGTGAVASSHGSGSVFTAATTEYTPLALTALDCTTARTCIAVGGDTLARIALPRTTSTRTRSTPAPATPGRPAGSGGLR